MHSQPFQPRWIIERVDLVRGHDHRLVLEAARRTHRGREKLELTHDHIVVVHRLTSARRGDVDEVNQHLGPLEMTQEAVAETLAVVRPFDQSGDVGNDEAALAGKADDAQVRAEGRERVVGDLRDAPPRCAKSSSISRRSGTRPGPRPRAASGGAGGPSLRPGGLVRRGAARDWSTWRTARSRARRCPLRNQHALAVDRQVRELHAARRPAFS